MRVGYLPPGDDMPIPERSVVDQRWTETRAVNATVTVR